MSDTPTVILVDDDPAMRRSVTLALELAGYRVQSFASGEKMLASLDPAQPGCLILDLRMPGMNGPEVQKTLNARGCTLPVIFISAFGDIPGTVRALKAGAVDFLEKPFSAEALITRIEEAFAIDRCQHDERTWRERMRKRWDDLTPREAEVMHFVTEGLSNKHIGAQLNISPRTVEKYRARVMEKMRADSVAELCQMASSLGDPESGPNSQ